MAQALFQVRKYLLKMGTEREHVKFWRPQILCLTHNPLGRCNVLEFVNNLKKGGLFILGDVVATAPPNETVGDTVMGAGGLPLGDSNIFSKVRSLDGT